MWLVIGFPDSLQCFQNWGQKQDRWKKLTAWVIHSFFPFSALAIKHWILENLKADSNTKDSATLKIWEAAAPTGPVKGPPFCPPLSWTGTLISPYSAVRRGPVRSNQCHIIQNERPASTADGAEGILILVVTSSCHIKQQWWTRTPE